MSIYNNLPEGSIVQNTDTGEMFRRSGLMFKSIDQPDFSLLPSDIKRHKDQYIVLRPGPVWTPEVGQFAEISEEHDDIGAIPDTVEYVYIVRRTPPSNLLGVTWVGEPNEKGECLAYVDPKHLVRPIETVEVILGHFASRQDDFYNTRTR